MKPNATPEQSLRIEVPLAFCPLFGETQRETNATRGSDNCTPTLEGGGWKPNGTKLAPEEWRNGALIQKVGGTFFKLVWGEQFGFGVRTSPTSPSATGRSPEANAPGCPQGCLVGRPRAAAADETETTDLARTPTHEPIFRQLLARQAEIGLSVFQTNHSDIEDDASCITVAQMDAKYRGFLGPRCGVKP